MIPAYLQALGAVPASNNCIELQISSDPVETNPPAADKTALGGLPAGARPTAWAHNSTLCGGDGTTSDCYAQLQPLAPGDDISDLAQMNCVGSCSISNGEQMVVVNTETQGTGYNVLVIRAVQVDACGTTTSLFTHNNGWTAVATPVGCGELVWWQPKDSAVSTALPDNAGVFSGHSASMSLNGVLTSYEAQSWSLPANLGTYAYGARNVPIPSGIGQYLSYGFSTFPPFQGTAQGVNASNGQSHAGEGCTVYSACTVAISPDGRPLGGSGGGQIPQWSQTATLVDGDDTYLIGVANNSGSPIYTSPITTSAYKTATLLAFAGYHDLYDISGPGSVVSSATPWTWCEAYNAGECFAGSTAGQVYEVVPGANTAGTCQQDGTILTPCFVIVPAPISWATQNEIDQSDNFGQLWRNETQCFDGPNMTINYWNMHGLATGDWNVCSSQWPSGARSEDLFAVLNPPWQQDSRTRFYFGGPTVSIAGGAGVTARIEFGYGTNLYCTSRAEVCTTATSDSDPYAFASETQAWTTCTSGCQITIPAIANRVLYYQVQTQVSGVTTTQPMQMVVN